MGILSFFSRLFGNSESAPPLDLRSNLAPVAPRAMQDAPRPAIASELIRPQLDTDTTEADEPTASIITHADDERYMRLLGTDFDSWMDEKAAKVYGEWFYAKLAGVTYRNDDGTERQPMIAVLLPFMELRLVRQPRNKFDSNAVAVMARGKRQLGFLPSDTARQITRALAEGEKVRCFVAEVGQVELDDEEQGMIEAPYYCTIGLLRWEPAV